MKLFLDDRRLPPPHQGWTLAEDVNEAIQLIKTAATPWTHLSLDFDLGFDSSVYDLLRAGGQKPSDALQGAIKPTGIELLKWMRENETWPKYRPQVHSANPVGAQQMRDFIDDFFPTGLNQ